jgi:hypothetical protein
MSRLHCFLLVTATACLAAVHRSPNFVVTAPTEEVARKVAEAAETVRKDQAVLWLGKEMPAWQEPCSIRVTLTMNASGGATTFSFDRGKVLSQEMQVEGTLERLFTTSLPHEITHTILAHHLRAPVPRWADEGAAILAEDAAEQARHGTLARQIVEGSRSIPLRRLFALKNYPSDVMALYVEGHSVTRFLVDLKGRPTFLAFVGQGMRDGWDKAAREHYGYQSVEDLEKAWLSCLHLKAQPEKDRLVPPNRNVLPSPVRE